MVTVQRQQNGTACVEVLHDAPVAADLAAGVSHEVANALSAALGVDFDTLPILPEVVEKQVRGSQ